MQRPLPSPRLAASEAAAPGAGLWAIDGDRLAELARFDVGPTWVLVPSEEVLLLVADLPLPSLRRRAEALPFAIEERIAAPIGEVHVALGGEVGLQRHIGAVVAHAAMARWTALTAEAGLERAALIPDALAIAMPAEGAWHVARDGGRWLARLPDGTGLALPEAQFEAAWRAAGEPARIDAVWPDRAALAAAALDLRQGTYARPRSRVPLIWRRAGAIVAAGLLAHGAIAAADTLALRRIAAAREAQARAAIARVAPGAADAGDLATAAADLLPASGAGPSHFLPLLSRTAQALRPLGAAAGFRSVSFDAAANTLSIEVETPDITGLQRVSSALAAAGLTAESGAASQSAGKAVGAFLVRGAA